MKKNQTKQTKPGKGATVRSYIVEWQAEGNSHCKTFPNLPRAKGYAKELTDTVIRLVKGGHDEDGDLAALVESVRDPPPAHGARHGQPPSPRRKAPSRR